MHWQHSPYTGPLAFSALITLLLAAYGWRQHRTPDRLLFIILMLAASEWAVVYALQLSSADLTTTLFWYKIRLGTALMPVTFLLLVLRQTGREQWLQPGVVLALITVPLVSTLLLAFPVVPGLYVPHPRLERVDGILILKTAVGVGDAISAVYNFSLSFLSMLLLAWQYVAAPGLYRARASALLAGATLPTLCSLLHVLHATPGTPIDVTPLSFSVAGVAWAFALFRYKLLDLVPIARGAVFQNMRDGVIVLDTLQRIVDMNPAAHLYLGLAGGLPIGQPLAQAIPDLAMLLRTPDRSLDDLELAVPTGAARQILAVQVSLLHDRRGLPSGRIIVLHESTERKQAELALRARTREAEAFDRVSTALSSALEPDRLYELILEQAATILPCDHGEVLLYTNGWVTIAANWGEPCVANGTRLHPLPDLIYARALAETSSPLYLADTLVEPTWVVFPPWVGAYQIRSLIIVPLRIDGELVGAFNITSYTPNFYTNDHMRIARAFADRVILAFRNARLYTAEQARRLAAQELADLRRDFVAAVSHELRTPLTAIVGYAELLDAHWNEFTEDARRERLRRIVRSSNRQLRLVEDLLLINRLESGVLAVRQEVTPLPAIAQQAVAEAQGNYHDQHIDLNGPANLQAFADPGRTLQVVANLVDNAAKYSPDGSPITVTWQAEESWAVLRVRDHGSGIPAQSLPRLFMRFGRVPGSRMRAGRSGTGLGLYLGRSLAEAMGGTLDLESTGPTGSTFALRLPLACQAMPGPVLQE